MHYDPGCIELRYEYIRQRASMSCWADAMSAALRSWSRFPDGENPMKKEDGYSAFTVGRKGVEELRRYIAKQAEHHQRKTFEEEYRDLLKACEIEFNER